MLAYILAVLVSTGSVGLYIAAFFLPEIHRKHDFIWSGVGFFYALALWIYARQITGGVLVGQTASVALLGWFTWQTLKLRRQLVPVNQQTPLPTKTQIQAQLGLKQPNLTPTQPVAQTSPKTPPKPPTPRAMATPPPTVSKSATVGVNAQQQVQPIPSPAIPDETVAQPEDEAWIKLEIKPSPPIPTSLAQVAPAPAPPSKIEPPTTETPQPPAIAAETVDQNTLTDAIQTQAQLEAEGNRQ